MKNKKIQETTSTLEWNRGPNNERTIFSIQAPYYLWGLGLLLAVLWLTIDFFKTLLIIIMTAIGAGIGFYLKQTGIVDQFFKS